MAHRKARKKTRSTNGMLTVALIVMVLFVAITVKRIELNSKSQSYAKTQILLQEKIDAANKEKEELEEQEKYMQTKKYIEEVAKEKLGLVNPDEKIFKADE